MAKTKQKNIKKQIEPNVRKIRKYLSFAFIFVAILGTSLGVLNWYGIIGS